MRHVLVESAHGALHQRTANSWRCTSSRDPRNSRLRGRLHKLAACARRSERGSSTACCAVERRLPPPSPCSEPTTALSMQLSTLPRALGATAALFALTVAVHAQTIGCGVGVTNGGAVPPSGSGGGGVYPTTLPTAPAAFNLQVAALPPGATAVTEVKLVGLAHSFVTDLQIVLTDPTGVRHNLFVRGTAPGDASYNCDFGGDYAIVPACTQTTLPLPQSCVGNGVVFPPGAYEQFFGRGQLAWPNGTNGIFNTPLSSIPAAAGVWTLTISTTGPRSTSAASPASTCASARPRRCSRPRPRLHSARRRTLRFSWDRTST
jgi:hypothetical protein